MQSIKRNPHRKPFKRVRPPDAARAAELITAAKRAEIFRIQHDGGGFMDFTAPWQDKYYPVEEK